MNQISFAIIGCGRIAQRHAEHISKRGILKAVCDINVEKAEKLASQYGCDFYSDIADLVLNEKSIDVIAICSPNGLHSQHAITCLNAGYNVICEKPMALSAFDCGEMIKAAEKSNKRLFAIKQNRFNPPVLAIKEVIEKGILGEIYSVQLSCFWNRNEDYYKDSWKGSKDLDGGTLYTQFSHFIDLLYWMIGDIDSVQAFTGNFAHKGIIEFEDTGVVIAKFKSGALGTINYTVNSYDKNMEGSLTIFAENGTVKIGGQYLNELEYQSIKNYNIEKLPQGNKPNNYGNYVGSMSNHDKVYDNLLDVLNNSGSINASLFDGLKTVEIIEKIYNSVKNDR
ncbi:Gfo/Idh/MocA family protein [Aquirufa lenticrescens]|uniref:Gfo/Idh/MocA family protein n=1 Tax=Aquirufa lenticrescens TaxID=2696560 RepID=UPI001CAA69FD|nr:Gfo/Idh/MocA family oxidoreductase [Aquirufa lenticrescens]UAJ14222.1 Gfo/Idh/MocA family oxidoreductase [Aquirufa lenticrescens]